MDIMFVNDVPYMTSITKALHYRTATPMPGMKDPQIFDAIDRIFRLYNDAGITITDVHADNQFASLLDPVKDELDITIHNPPAGGRVPEAERNIRVIKERIRATYHRLPYKAPPRESYEDFGYGISLQTQLLPKQTRCFQVLQSSPDSPQEISQL